MKNERHPIDEFFREALEEYKIPPGVEQKKSFLEDAEKVLSKESGKKWFFLLPVIMLILSLGVISYLEIVRATSNGNPGDHKKSTIRNTRDIRPSEKPEPVDRSYAASRSSIQPQVFNTSSSVLENTESKKVSQEETNEQEASHTAGKPSGLLSSAGFANEQSQPPESALEATGLPLQGLIIPADTLNKKNDSTGKANSSFPVADSLKSAGQDTVLRTSNAAGKKEWRISSALYFSPEWMFHTLEDTKFVTNFGLEGTFRFGRYSIRTGAGISITKGTNQLMVEYNDFRGSYLCLDSMTFAWDEKHYYLLPTYYLSNKDVYDSLLKLDDAKIIKRYTYLQVPLILGYDFIQKEKMSFGLRAGPIMSILLGERTLSEPYEAGKKRIISMNEVTPEQVNLNWQILVGINATFRLSRKLGIELEPFGKYYFNSVYETSGESGKPWSIGIRAALFISF